MSPKILLAVIWFAFFGLSVARLTREECALARDELDVCGRELLVLGDLGQQLPTRADQLVAGHCRLVNESIACVNSYAENCLSTHTKAVFHDFLARTRVQLELRCHEHGHQLLQSAECLNARAVVIHECVDRFVFELEAIRDSVTNKELITPYACCRFADLKRCIEAPLKTSCAHYASAVEPVLDGLLEPLESLLCTPDCNAFYTCHKLEQLEVKLKLDGTDLVDRAVSPLVPIVDLVNSLAPIDPCVTAREHVDDCATRLLVFGDREQRFAVTATQLERNSCPLLNTSIECISAYKQKCALNSTLEPMLDSLTAGARREYADRCVSESGRKRSLRASVCLNRQLDAMHACYDRYVAELESLADETEDRNLRRVYLCCRFHAMRKCAVTAAGHSCDADGVQYLQHQIDNTAADFLRALCAEHYESALHCEALDPIDIEFNDRKETSPSGYASYAQSFVRVLLDLLDKH